MATKRLNKKDLENKKQLAYLLFMSGEEQKMIAELATVSEKTVSKWVTEEKWKEKRSAATVTRDELINKTLQLISQMLEGALSSGDKNFISIADAINKAAGTIEKLDKKGNVVQEMEAFTKLNRHMMQAMQEDKELTPAVIKLFNRHQIAYINKRIAGE